MDVETADALATLLNNYKAASFVSHDRTFLSRVATKVIEVRADSLLPYEGNLGRIYILPSRRPIRFEGTHDASESSQ